jgi:hypothetical protein
MDDVGILQTSTSHTAFESEDVLPHVLQHWIMPPYSGGLHRYHVSHGFGSCLRAREGSDAVMCLVAPDPASLLERAPVLPRVPRHRILPLCLGGL